MSWLKDIDGLLRGRDTSTKVLDGGTSHLRLSSYVTAIILLGAFCGACMGLFGVVNREQAEPMQMLASAAKTPLLFLLVLVITFPSLYVFSALQRTRLSFLDMLRLLVATSALMVVILASLGPISAFFCLTTSSYPFMKLLQVAFFAVAGLIGLKILSKAVGSLREKPEEREEPIAPAPPADALPNESPGAEARPPFGMSPSPASRTPTPFPRKTKSGESFVFSVWLILYMLVASQTAWLLRPFIGDPGLPFAWFRPRTSNVFLNILRTIGEMLNG